MNEREYQNSVKETLDSIYSDVSVQWCPFEGEGRNIYAPVVDVAVGPFATEERYEERYTELLEETFDFIESLISMHNSNVQDRTEQTSLSQIMHFNENARCLLCIEIEETGSAKHLIGDLVNASALGRIGLLVARSKQSFDSFIRQRVYLSYLADVGKNTFKTDNALILTEKQFNECLSLIKTKRSE